jgi:hypothetical protein
MFAGGGCFQAGTIAGGAAYAYCGLGTECDVLNGKRKETCAGTVLQFCAAGIKRTIDCATLGYKGCAAGGIDTSGACSP